MDHGATPAGRSVGGYAYLLQPVPSNPSSLHFFGREARQALNESRER